MSHFLYQTSSIWLNIILEHAMDTTSLTLDALSFKKFAIQVQKYIRITLGVNDIDQEAYSLTFKSAKSNGGGLELSDSNDFGKFLNEYEKLHRLQKEIVVIVQMKQKFDKKKKRKQVKEEVLESDDNSKKKKMNAVPKISGLTPHQKAIGKLVSEFCEQ
ncbi:hypothetical protein C1645_819566 [Glomus cerebriforme]|uniref:Uncharacterized protein n=1 Tax=Glomus cerebriforme TaxID=658196 RepID=A0A397T4H8_9GLOM|nr:hypothetical protein C1645_819566 [Glomus cerebriforme]